MNHKHNILLFGNASYLNRGCEAIITNISKTIKELDNNNKITVATFDISNDKKFHNNLVDRYISHYWSLDQLKEEYLKLEIDDDINLILQKEILDDIKREDIIMSVGGDNYCYKDNLKFLYTIDDFVRKNNKKLVLFGASINEDVLSDEFIEDIRRFDIVLVRESLTYKLLSKFIDKEKLIMGPDIAFSLEAREVKLQNNFNCKNDVVGLNMSSLILAYQKEGANVLSSVLKLVDYILENYQYKIALIPHVYISGGNDLDTLREIKSFYPNNDRVFVVDDRMYDCNELKYIISKCKFLIAARTHASIAGYSSLVPTLVLGYSVKSKGIAKDIFGDFSDFVLPVQDLASEEKLIEKFEFLIKNEKEIKEILFQKMPIYFQESKNLFKIVLSQLKKLEKENVTKKENCSGCSACFSSCPVGAIKMEKTSEGFSYPVIDQDICIDCGICKKVCPNNNQYAYEYVNTTAYACKNISENERIKSSSGGIFSLLAKDVLAQGGCVFGASYENYNVKHIKIDKENDLCKLRGSKYVESTIGDCFVAAKKELDLGRKVLFSGVPCQIEGLKGFLGNKDYKNLYCVSVVCHGVPSKEVFLAHLKELEAFYDDKLIKINFRNKENGWKNYNIEYVFEKKTIKMGMREDKYMSGFLKNYFLRQSCYSCDCRIFKKNTADVILGDFWGVENVLKDFDDNNGISAAIVNSEKGEKLFGQIDKFISKKDIDIDNISRYNPNLVESVRITERRFEFFDIFEKMGFNFAMDYFSEKDELFNFKKDSEETKIRINQLENQLILLRESSVNQLSELLASRKWRFINKVIKIFNYFFPHGTIRRKFLRMGYKAFFRAINSFKIIFQSLRKPKLVMTLLVKDEADIVEKNIIFHLRNGVDFIIATDNDSKDGTREILEKYQNKGVLHLIDEKGKDHSQSKWVNRMGEIAFKQYNADIIFHCDADEFWFPSKGNIKSEIWKSNADIMVADVVNVLMEDRNGNEKFPKDTKYAVIKPILTKNLKESSKKKNLYLFKYPSKVIFKTKKQMFEVGEGNHEVLNNHEVNNDYSRNIKIYHFPLRGKEMFFNKVKKGGKALSLNKELDKEIGFHWRAWYELYKKGELGTEYKKMNLSRKEIAILKKEGIIKEINFKKNIIK